MTDYPITGVDYAWGRPDLKLLSSLGYEFIVRYLSWDKTGKNLTPQEARDAFLNGLDVISNWEYDAMAAAKGYSQGISDAKEARRQHEADGGPSRAPIYFSVDWDVPDYAPNSTDNVAKLGPVAEYFLGISSVLPPERVGAYGGYWVIRRLFDVGLIRYGWQTIAWSGGAWEPRAQLRQYAVGITVAGVDCDLNEAVVSDYGGWATPEGVGMEQTDQIVGHLARQGRGVGDVFCDLSNARDWWYDQPDGTASLNPPSAGTRAQLLVDLAIAYRDGKLGAVAGNLTPADLVTALTGSDALLDAIAGRVVAQLVSTLQRGSQTP